MSEQIELFIKQIGDRSLEEQQYQKKLKKKKKETNKQTAQVLKTQLWMNLI
jgi:hypothetical protein